ncbi:homeobox protein LUMINIDEPENDENS isoform X2 [Humulus lupulus]|uniref:homeobox protein LUMINIDEPENDENS isoform X2 n=1 Tax=Humulus lupulus TaxID=3486 RepID=UPI002B4114AD|nr:homeobox protein LUMINIDEPENDENS isoform X2 [Humulus lupulus]
MKASKESFLELQIGTSAESLQKSLGSQRELFHSQIDQLQRIVVTQCRLTGANPLSQEMAAGALSIKIGKRPRDLLNPKAVKYMQSVFSVKDAVSKKECREICALYGVTVTQVREFFASQRSRVRRLVRLSRENATKSNSFAELNDGVHASSDLLLPIQPVPLNTIGPTSVEETPPCSTKDDVLPGIDDLDKQFVENIFSLMRKEETYSGQVKLMEWILQIKNSAVLYWFLSKGGMMILATWLSQAAEEEQTSILFVILNVLCHLPLHKALPVHMSAILQSVNRLRFYRTSDISNRARILLSKWSKLLANSEALKKPNCLKFSSDAQQQIMLKQSLSDVIGDDSWQSSIDTSENLLDSSENVRKSEPIQSVKLLPASSDDSTKKHILGLSSSQFRERRKVQLVEQPGQRAAGRSPQTTRAGPLNQGRPMSADDIQKAKLRAQYMQSKYVKANSSCENKAAKTEALNKPSTSQVSNVSTASKVLVRPSMEEHKKPTLTPLKVPNTLEASLESKPRTDLKESAWEKRSRVQNLWQTPPEVKLSQQWRVGTGDNSKEAEFQKNRNRREKETFYQTNQEIPLNPKEPWDREMDYDDSLTPEIPIEQLPEPNGGSNAEAHVSPKHGVDSAVTQIVASQRAVGSVPLPPDTSQSGNASTAEPDLELLAVLLKNPELVFALTSGQAANLSSEETVKLLDMIKAGNATSNNGINRQVEEKVEVSLPSPTPSTNPGTSGWRPEGVRNPFSRVPLPKRVAESPPAVATAKSVLPSHMLAPHNPPVMSSYSLSQVTSMVHEKYSPLGSSLHQPPLTSSSIVHTNLPPATGPMYNLHPQDVSSLRLESATNIKPQASMSNNMYNVEERRHHSFPTLLPVAPSRLMLPHMHQQQYQPQQQQQHYAEPSPSVPMYSKQIGKSSNAPDSWRPQQNLPSNYNPIVNQNNSNYHRGLYVEEDEFESWSPDNSPSRNSEYGGLGRSFPEPRMDSGRGYRPTDQSRVRSSPGYRDSNRHGNRRWRDQRRR